jgi:hypothetical protein
MRIIVQLYTSSPLDFISRPEQCFPLFSLREKRKKGS